MGKCTKLHILCKHCCRSLGVVSYASTRQLSDGTRQGVQTALYLDTVGHQASIMQASDGHGQHDSMILAWYPTMSRYNEVCTFWGQKSVCHACLAVKESSHSVGITEADIVYMVSC